MRAARQANAIQHWMRIIIQRLNRYKDEHKVILKEATTLLELALWKTKLLNEKEDNCNLNVKAKKAKIDAESARKGHRVTCGADTVIKNVLPFLALN